MCRCERALEYCLLTPCLRRPVTDVHTLQILTHAVGTAVPRLGAFEVSAAWVQKGLVLRHVGIFSKLRTALFPCIPLLIKELESTLSASTGHLDRYTPVPSFDSTPRTPRTSRNRDTRARAGEGEVLDSSTRSNVSLEAVDDSCWGEDDLGALKAKVFWRRRRHGPCVENLVWPRLKKNFVGVAAGERGLVCYRSPHVSSLSSAVFGGKNICAHASAVRAGRDEFGEGVGGCVTARASHSALDTPGKEQQRQRRRRNRPGSAPVSRGTAPAVPT